MCAAYLVFSYEKTRTVDAGTPDKVSMAHHSAGADSAFSRITTEEIRSFSPAFRWLLAHREKGYVSLMHVQAQIGQASHLTPGYESQTDEETAQVTIGGL